MSQLHGDNDYSRDRVTIKTLISLILIGLIIVGYAISEDKIPIINKAVTAEQENDGHVPSTKSQSNFKNGQPITGTRG